MGLSIKERAAITRQLDAGCPIRGIAEEFDVAVGDVLSIARRYRQQLLSLRRKIETPPPLVPEKLEPLRFEGTTYEWHSASGYPVTLPLLSIQRG